MSRFLMLSSSALLALAAPAVAQAQTPPGYEDATRAYAAAQADDPVAAVEAARRALTASPENLEWRLLLVDELVKLGRHAEALEALQPVATLDDYRVQTRRAEAAKAVGDPTQAAQAFGVAAVLAQDADARAYLLRAQALALVEGGRRDEARAVLRGGHEAGALPGDAPLDFAYVAVAAGDEDLALDGFQRADAAQALTGPQALDAAYAARRAGRDRDAALWLKQGAETLPPEELTPQRRHEIGREVEALERRWGGSASLTRGATSTTTAAASPGTDATQAGAEAWFRLGGYNDGRPVDLFARSFVTLENEAGPSGGATAQGWVGVRYKPFSDQNLILEASRMVKLGSQSLDDTMLRASWSVETGGDIRYDRESWPNARLYVDAARLLEAGRTLGVVDASVGWTWVTTRSRRDLVTVGLGARLDHDDALAEQTAVGVGPRIAWRRWLGGDGLSAPGSYLDLSVGYDFSVQGDRDGPRVSLSLIF